MMTIEELYEILEIGESQEIEFKSAKGGLPKSLWSSLSAFANTAGGYIVLGVDEKDGAFLLGGVTKPNEMLKQFWDTHNNSEKINTPICKEDNISLLTIEEQVIVVIYVPMATKRELPIYLNGNPYKGTYKRSYEGDYRCSKDEVNQMLRDASLDAQDFEIVEDFGLDDIDMETLISYKNRFRNNHSDHPYLALNDKELLIQIGAYRKDRRTKIEGLTLAGLIVFGKERSILDAFPYFCLDYQEKLSTNPDDRWTYRITHDGTWECNIYNFYYRVYNRIIQDIEVPFALDSEGMRIGETHLHEAIREVMVNTLIHADHQATKCIVIVKNRDYFQFNNPGRLRITIEQLYSGGVSDPRNPNVQKIFQFLGLGEKAGSGFAKILRAWNEQSWFKPLVSVDYNMELTHVLLPFLSMIPEKINNYLLELIGEEYQDLNELQRLILIMAHKFLAVKNEEIASYSTQHPRDIGEILKQMVKKGWLISSGVGRGMNYKLNRDYLQGGQVGGQALLKGGQVGGQAQKEIDIKANITVSELIILKSLLERDKSAKELKSSNTKGISGAFKERLSSLLQKKLIIYTIPDKPTSPKQRYRLTSQAYKILEQEDRKRPT